MVISKYLYLFLIGVFLSACALKTHVRKNEIFDAKYHLVTESMPHELAFSVTLFSDDTKNICISYEQWPRSNGLLHGPAGRASFVAESSEFKSKNNNFGHCNTGVCAFVIKPGQKLDGYILYSNFDNYEHIKEMEKVKLIYEVSPWIGKACKLTKKMQVNMR